MTQDRNFSRRFFLGSAASITGTAALASASLIQAEQVDPKITDNPPVSEKPLVDSPPMLQNPTPQSISASWAINGTATAWIEYGENPGELNMKANNPKFGLEPLQDRYVSIGIEGLKPNTTYHYRTVTVPITYNNAYDIKRGEPHHSPVYSFTTCGENAETCSFAVINDTHQNEETLNHLVKRIADTNADYTIWNGDLMNDVYSDDQIVRYIMRPGGMDAPFAAAKPLLFVHGNHDSRGPCARRLPELMTPWKHGDGEDTILGRNFAVRKGPLALIGLDTGEDKPDNHPVFSGLAAFEPLKIAQQNWLKRVLKRPDIASAPFIVAICHIPLFDANPDSNGGETLEGYASHSAAGRRLWGSLLDEAGVQLVICAHMHRYRYDKPAEGRKWAQLVGGGPSFATNATFIRAETRDGKLLVTAEKLNGAAELGSWKFEPRTKK